MIMAFRNIEKIKRKKPVKKHTDHTRRNRNAARAAKHTYEETSDDE